MKISTRGRYGLKAMVDLAIHSSEEKPLSLKNVAERQGISDNYLEQQFAILKKAGLVKSARGAQGGYFLSKCPSEITVGNILRALEGSLSPVDCVESDSACGSANCKICTTKTVWNKIYDSLNEVIDSISLESLALDSQKLGDEKIEQDLF